MSVLTIIARLKAKPGCEADLERELSALLAPTRAEKGCIQYDMHRSHQDPGLFYFYENWESRELWNDHMKTPHITGFGAKQGDLAESWELFEGEKVG